MATIIGGIAASHTPTIGFALDRDKRSDPAWAPIFEAFDPLRAWLDVQRGLSPTTQIAYGTDLRQLALFLAQRGASLARPAEVSKKHIQAWLARLYALGEAKSSMARKLAAARTFFRRPPCSS